MRIGGTELSSRQTNLEQRTTLCALKISVPHLTMRSAVETSSFMALPTTERLSWLITGAGLSALSCWDTEGGCCL